MAPLRSLPIGSALRSSSRAGARSASRQWRRPGRRSYATNEGAKSEGGGVTQTLMNDLPWAIPAVAVTIGGSYFLLKDAHLGPLYNHPMPGDNYHGEEHEEGEEDEEGKGEDESEEGEQESSTESNDKEEEDGSAESKQDEGSKGSTESDEGEQQQDQQNDESSQDSKGQSTPPGADDSKKTKGRTAGKNFNETSADGTLKRKDVKSSTQDGNVPRADQTHELEHDVEGGRKLHIPDSKGGARLRIESPRGEKLGQLDDSGEIGRDTAAASKTPDKGATSGKQAGLSNTETKYPAKQLEGMSEKSPGTPETAKLQGTVDPHGKRRGNES